METVNLYARKAILLIAGILVFCAAQSLNVQAADPIIIDHHCTDIWQIPETAIEQAKTELHIAYGHTSHGSQLTSGMGSNNGGYLDQFMTANGATPGLYLWNNGGSGGALDLHNYFMSGDLGNPDRYTWEQRTRSYLDNPANADVNVIIWSWCGQAETSIANIDIYLSLMEGLINDYPGVQFVFMTGHLNGTGPTGQLHLANEHIREHCRANNRILFDFADIESYDPDGLVNYMELSADDACNYDSDGNGTRDRNWALEWQASHVEGTDWWPSGAAHSQHLNGNLKGYAAWWLWATLAGWNTDIPPVDPSSLVSSLSESGIDLTWTDNSDNEEFFVLERQRDVEGFIELAELAADTTFYQDSSIEPYYTYTYRVKARNSSGDSGYSNEVSEYVPEACIVDIDWDGDLDGEDLAGFSVGYTLDCIADFAEQFGSY